MIVKVCGMREEGNIADVAALGINLMGFILYPKSGRYVSESLAATPKGIGRVGVFVNEPLEVITAKCQELRLDYAQLHGDESPELCNQVAEQGIKVIKAFQIATKEDFKVCAPYQGVAELFVFDTKSHGYGGSGRSFDWQILDHYSGTTPFLLSGGISGEDGTKIASIEHPQMVGVDLNSRFETAPAVKNVELLKQFIDEIR